MNLETYLDKYISYISDVKEYSKHTVNSYGYDIKAFINYLENKLSVGNSVTLINTLSVKKGTFLESSLSIGGGVVFSSTLNVLQPVKFEKKL